MPVGGDTYSDMVVANRRVELSQGHVSLFRSSEVFLFGNHVVAVAEKGKNRLRAPGTATPASALPPSA